MKRYSVRMGGGAMDLTESDIAVLYRSGGITTGTACMELGKDWWRTIDEMFPLLKYEGRASSLYDQYPSEQRPSKTSAMAAGWICFGIGAVLSWFFPLGYSFFGVAVIMAVVAMATHQISRGLILLLSSFVAMGVTLVISFALAIGLFAAAADHAITKARDQSLKRNTVIGQQLNPFNQTLQNTTSQDDLTRQINQMNQAMQQSAPAFSQASSARSQTLPARPRPVAVVPSVTQPSIDTSVEAQLRRIEQQKRARESYKQQHDSLQRSIDYWESSARNTKKGSRTFSEKQVDSLRKQLQELNNKNLGM